MKLYIAATALAALTGAVDPNSKERNIYTFAYIGTRGDCINELNSPCVSLLDYENTSHKGIKMFTQIMENGSFEACVNKSPSCEVDLSVVVSIGPERQCSSEAGISFYIPEFKGWTLHSPIVPDQEFRVEGGKACIVGTGVFVMKDEAEDTPVCNLRNPLKIGFADQVTWMSNTTQFSIYHPLMPKVEKDVLQILANPNPDIPNCKFRAVDKPFYTLKFKTTLTGTGKTSSTTSRPIRSTTSRPTTSTPAPTSDCPDDCEDQGPCCDDSAVMFKLKQNPLHMVVDVLNANNLLATDQPAEAN